MLAGIIKKMGQSFFFGISFYLRRLEPASASGAGISTINITFMSYTSNHFFTIISVNLKVKISSQNLRINRTIDQPLYYERITLSS
jgi:hypothetical protein